MHNFVHVLMLACEWCHDHYLAVQSDSSQYYLDVYLKKASSIKDAMNSRKKWVKQKHRISWVSLMYYLAWDTTGMEMLAPSPIHGYL